MYFSIMNKNTDRKNRKLKRTRSKILRKKSVRLSVFRSNKQIYAQIIDDGKSKTLAAFSSKNLKKESIKGKRKTEIAKMVGMELAKVSLKKNIKKVIFDRGAYRYHGRVKALAEGAREGGLIF